MTLARYAEDRAREAWEARIKHVRASNTWAEIAAEHRERRPVYEILARWMAAYADADAEAERAFRELATRGDTA